MDPDTPPRKKEVGTVPPVTPCMQPQILAVSLVPFENTLQDAAFPAGGDGTGGTVPSTLPTLFGAAPATSAASNACDASSPCSILSTVAAGAVKMPSTDFHWAATEIDLPHTGTAGSQGDTATSVVDGDEEPAPAAVSHGSAVPIRDPLSLALAVYRDTFARLHLTIRQGGYGPTCAVYTGHVQTNDS